MNGVVDIPAERLDDRVAFETVWRIAGAVVIPWGDAARIPVTITYASDPEQPGEAEAGASATSGSTTTSAHSPNCSNCRIAESGATLLRNQLERVVSGFGKA